MINIEDFKKVEIKAGKILSAELIEGSEKLLKLSVDFGPNSAEASLDEGRDMRQVVSGIRKYFSDPQELVGVTTAFVTNLEPRPIMGLESQAMILATHSDNNFSLLKIDDNIAPGSLVG